MSWQLRNGSYEFVNLVTPARVVQSTSTTDSSGQFVSGDSVELGTFVEHAGIPSTTINSTFKHENIANAAHHLQEASLQTKVCAGVVQSQNDGKIRTMNSGVVLAWIVAPKKRLLSYNGI